MRRTVGSAPGRKTIHKKLDAAGIAQRNKDEAARAAHIAGGAYKEAREAEYVGLGWVKEFDVVEDILDRGVDAVKADRDAVKARHPKPQGE